MRTRVSYGAAFGYFIFPERIFPEKSCLGKYVQTIPILRDIICYTNDIISFYKERILAKVNSFISNISREKAESDLDYLKWLCEHTLSMDNLVQGTLEQEPDIQKAYKAYVLGYIEWHFRVGRYSLDLVGLNLVRT